MDWNTLGLVLSPCIAILFIVCLVVFGFMLGNWLGKQ